MKMLDLSYFVIIDLAQTESSEAKNFYGSETLSSTLLSLNRTPGSLLVVVFHPGKLRQFFEKPRFSIGNYFFLTPTTKRQEL